MHIETAGDFLLTILAMTIGAILGTLIMRGMRYKREEKR